MNNVSSVCRFPKTLLNIIARYIDQSLVCLAVLNHDVLACRNVASCLRCLLMLYFQLLKVAAGNYPHLPPPVLVILGRAVGAT